MKSVNDLTKWYGHGSSNEWKSRERRDEIFHADKGDFVRECSIWSDSFQSACLTVLALTGGNPDMSRPVRIVIDYDPNEPRTFIDFFHPKEE